MHNPLLIRNSTDTMMALRDATMSAMRDQVEQLRAQCACLEQEFVRLRNPDDRGYSVHSAPGATPQEMESNLQVALQQARQRLGLANPESTQANLKNMARCVELESELAASERQAIQAEEAERRTREQRDSAIVDADIAKQELRKLREAHGIATPGGAAPRLPQPPRPGSSSYVTKSFSLGAPVAPSAGSSLPTFGEPASQGGGAPALLTPHAAPVMRGDLGAGAQDTPRQHYRPLDTPPAGLNPSPPEVPVSYLQHLQVEAVSVPREEGSSSSSLPARQGGASYPHPGGHDGKPAAAVAMPYPGLPSL